MRTHTQTVLHNNPIVKGLARSGVMHERATEAPFLQGTGKRNGSMSMDAVTVDGGLSPTPPGYASVTLMLENLVTNPFGPGLVQKAAEKRGDGLNVAVSRKRGNYERTFS